MSNIEQEPAQSTSLDRAKFLRRRFSWGIGILTAGAVGALYLNGIDNENYTPPKTSPFAGSPYTMKQLSAIPYGREVVRPGNTPLSLIAKVQGDSYVMNRNTGLRNEMIADINNQADGGGQALIPGQIIRVPDLLAATVQRPSESVAPVTMSVPEGSSNN
jgi:hypothetical protein